MMRTIWFSRQSIKIMFFIFLILLAVVFCWHNLLSAQHSVLPAISWQMIGKVIVLDPGHGGDDPGVIGVTGCKEEDVNLAVALILKKMLTESGAIVVMTREDDSSLADKKAHDLQARVELSKKYQADAFISIHSNAFPGSQQWRGAQVFFANGNEQGEKLAKYVQEALRKELKNTTREALVHKSAYLLKNITIPAIIGEIGFLSCGEEEQLLQNPDYQWQVAWSFYTGIVRFFAAND